jgi:hypothetical protein
MHSFQDYRRLGLLPLAGLALAAYFLLYYLPLARRVDNLDVPLQKAWRKLSLSIDQTNATTIDFLQLSNQLSETRQARTILEATKKEAATRLQLSADLQSKLNAPFQLVDYEYERSKKMDELDRRARELKTTVDPAVYAGFPEHTADTTEPALLWPALSLTDDLLQTAVRCKVTAIHSLDVPLALTNSPGTDSAVRWSQIPLQLEFTAAADNAMKFIQSLPLRAEEARAAGLIEVSPQKVPLLLDRLMIRKQSPDKQDEVRVWLRVVGFVLRDQ